MQFRVFSCNITLMKGEITKMYKEYPKFYNYEVLDYGRKSRSDDPLLSVDEVLAKHDKIIEEYAENEFSHEEFENNISDLVKTNSTLVLCKKMEGLEPDEMILFLFCLCKYIYEGDCHITGNEYRRLFEKNKYSFLQRSIINRTNNLFFNTLNYFEH